MSSRIQDYALISNGRTAALVGRDGSIDWLCLPRFDSAACCAALLGNEEHGYWQIGTMHQCKIERRYDGDTMVLRTEYALGPDKVRMTDYMAMGTEQPVLVRRLEGLSGTLQMRCDLRLRFDYGLVPPIMHSHQDALVLVSGPDLVSLRSPVPLTTSREGRASAEFTVHEGQVLDFVLAHGPSHGPVPPPLEAAQTLLQTLTIWRDWVARFQRETRWREPVIRSLLTMKALSYHPTGAVVAAPTTSLPEMPGGGLNWDYRYCWLRDATFMLSAFLNAGYKEEALRWRDWMLRTIGPAPDKMRIMYRVDGDRRLHEETVDWLPGYHGAAPVRVGNDAATQRQTDVVGELLDALDLIERAGVHQDEEVWATQCDLVRHLEKTWQDSGHGLWESRGETQRYTYSTVMAWAGADRFLENARRRGIADAGFLKRIRELRQRIRAQIMERCWNDASGHFVDRDGGEHVDASLLLMPLVNFLPANDPRMSATIDAIERELSQDGLIWRTPHGGDTDQGAFIACTSWLADCRALQGRRREAVVLLERVLSLRNDVGLLSEEYHPGLQQLVGNFPQALSHLALVNTALGLSGPVLQRGGG